MGYKLNIHLIPKGAYGQNMRSAMAPSEWRKLSAYVREPGVCAGCWKSFAPSRLDAHEVWTFKHGKQKLRRVVPLCKACHQAAHIGRARAEGHLEEAASHLMEVRGFSKRRFLKEYSAAWERWEDLSKRKKWRLVTSPEEAWEIARLDRTAIERKAAAYRAERL